ncbi:MAG: hypothetical protein Q9225_006618 [Loekoesia sp. 1 TL-2023]
MAVENDRPVKRSSFTAGFDIQVATKRSKLGLGHSKITQDINGTGPTDAVTLDDEGVEILLTRSISLALDVVGFGSADPLALESFRVGVEEYMHRFAADVRHSMLSCRRTQATAQDFLQTLHIHQLSLRTLLPHLRPPVPKRRARIVLPYEPPTAEEEYDHQFLGTNLDDASVEQGRYYVPQHFPAFPSKHTYKATAEYPDREEDPRKIRERATEEGRLGEEALRRLVSAKTADRPSSARSGQRVQSIRSKREELWKETMETASANYIAEHLRNADDMELDISEHEPGLLKTPSSDYGRISSAVNADRKFWRKPAPTQRSSKGGKDITT